MTQPTTKNSKRWTVDLTLGNRWRYLPLVAFAVPLILRIIAIILDHVGSYRSILAVDISGISLIIAISGIPYVAIALQSSGTIRKQKIAGVLTLAAALPLTVVDSRNVWPVFVPFFLFVIQHCVMMFFDWPRWRSGEALQRPKPVTITYLISVITAIAILLYLAQAIGDKMALLTIAQYTFVTFVLWNVAAFFGTVRSSQVSAIFGCIVVTSCISLTLYLLIAPFNQHRFIVLFASLHFLVMWPPWMICFLQRTKPTEVSPEILKSSELGEQHD